MNITKLQRIIIDALEDVKGQDIEIFNVTHLTPLFDRVIIASGTSNRQTRALAMSVRDKVKEAARDGIEKGLTKGARAVAEAAGVTDPSALEAIEKATEAAIKAKGEGQKP